MNLERFKFKGLRKASVTESLMKVASRVTLSAPFQIPVYWAVVLRHERYLNDPVTIFFFILILVNIALRVFLFMQRRAIIERPNGEVMFRLVFGLIMVLIGCAWGGTTAYLVYNSGITVETSVTILAMFGTVATMAGFSFDLPLTLVGQGLMLGPVTITLLCLPGEVRVFGYMVALYAIYIWLLSVSFNSVQFQGLKSLEAIEDQEAKLRVTHKSLQEQHDLTNAMLDNINQVFLIFDETGVCNSIASHRSSELLGLDPSGLNICDVLRTPKAERDSTLNWYRLLFLNRLPFNEVVERGPKQIIIDGGKRILKLEFHPMFSDTDTLHAVIFTATDMTVEVGAFQKFERQREIASMILAINQNRLRFRDFIRDFEIYLEKTLLSAQLLVPTVHRELHNFKATAFLFRAAPVGRMIHEVELAVRKQDPSEEDFRGILIHLESTFAAWKAQETPLFAQLGVFDERGLEISQARFQELEHSFSGTESEREVFAKIKKSLVSVDVNDRLLVFKPHVTQLASRLSKKVELSIVSSTSSVEIPFDLHRDVFRSLIHLFNNAVDHGIESSEARVRAGKSEQGKIEVTTSRVERDGRAWLKLVVADDGGGIKLHSGTHQLLVKSDQPASIHELSEFIFTNGRSSRTEVSEVSGLGFGMSAVRAAVLKVGGVIELLRTGPRGTEFEIQLPLLS